VVPRRRVYDLFVETEYSLPFKVSGFVDPVGCEKTDGSGKYYGRYLVIGRDGEVRTQEKMPPEGPAWSWEQSETPVKKQENLPPK
jgi:hypothetical protein